ncbi:PhzF family phenazine biosynthesis protein [Streptomyces sp. NPDC052013]|uniref:PhzF family phenazine biosynthesis protein n=1 Tax=Streptomyces sp. NPDC052013 TaxID=3365679 RepID=UPI0037D61581
MARPVMLPRRTIVVSGLAFVDTSDPYNGLGNPFAVVIGADVGTWDVARRQMLARGTGAPETVFIDALREPRGQMSSSLDYELDLTILTPTGKSLGACAHGFLGAAHVLTEAGFTEPGHNFTIRTSAGGLARSSLSRSGTVMLHFVSQEPRIAYGHEKALEKIFHLRLPSLADGLPILSVGSPKLTVEVTSSTFAELRLGLDSMDYEELMALQRKLDINGIHLFCRNGNTSLPERVIQVNAYLGRSLCVDRATGVSSAAQVSADPYVRNGQELQITQYTRVGRSASLSLTKGENRHVHVGGAAIVVDYQRLR